MEAGRTTKYLPLLAASAACLIAVGCGMPGAPLPPSLNLPQPVKDLHAVRTGDQVALNWTMPRRNTDQLLLKDTLHVLVCRAESSATACTPVGELSVAPGGHGAFADQLPAALATGTPRALTYSVQVQNARHKAAGVSNLAHVVAGQAPAPVTALQAELRKNGVLVRWTPIADDQTPVRLERHLLTPQAESKKHDPLAQPDEPTVEKLLITARVAEGHALDRTARVGAIYEYSAQRIARVTVNDQTFELAGGVSNSIRVEVRDIFPPDPPQGLAAVAAAPESGPAVDLNWQPNTEADIAGYIVYRREGNSEWHRVSPSKLLTAPAFRDTSVEPGHSYRYAVTAVDTNGHPSRRSAEAEESVPAE